MKQQKKKSKEGKGKKIDYVQIQTHPVYIGENERRKRRRIEEHERGV
jgi:hypothetical protein